MAADPSVIACPADTWILVAEGVTTGAIHRRSTRPNVYVQTTRVSGNPAPGANDLTDAARVFNGGAESIISSDAPIDVYIRAVRVAGEVRVDL